MNVSKKVDVVLLAAGKGVRLGNLTNNLPKCLLPLSNHDTVLDVYLKLFLSVDIVRNICIMGGYAISSISDHLKRNWTNEMERGKILLIGNPIYETTNNIVTFIQSGPFFRSGGILIEADLVCSPEIFLNVIESVSNSPHRSILVIDESRKDRPDAMRISKHQNGLIDKISKTTELSISEGEYLGIAYLTPNDSASAIKICQNLVDQGKTNMFYEEGFATGTSNKQLELYSLSTGSAVWSEIDDVEDYKRAKALYESFLER